MQHLFHGHVLARLNERSLPSNGRSGFRGPDAGAWIRAAPAHAAQRQHKACMHHSTQFAVSPSATEGVRLPPPTSLPLRLALPLLLITRALAYPSNVACTRLSSFVFPLLSFILPLLKPPHIRAPQHTHSVHMNLNLNEPMPSSSYCLMPYALGTFSNRSSPATPPSRRRVKRTHDRFMPSSPFPTILISSHTRRPDVVLRLHASTLETQPNAQQLGAQIL